MSQNGSGPGGVNEPLFKWKVGDTLYGVSNVGGLVRAEVLVRGRWCLITPHGDVGALLVGIEELLKMVDALTARWDRSDRPSTGGES